MCIFMQEWTVVTALVTLFGLGVAVIRPIISLNSVIVRLTDVVNALEEDFSSLAKKNNEAHARIWEKVEEQDGMLVGHEIRLTLIEKTREAG